jgi:hypothetical protein
LRTFLKVVGIEYEVPNVLSQRRRAAGEAFARSGVRRQIDPLSFLE